MKSKTHFRLTAIFSFFTFLGSIFFGTVALEFYLGSNIFMLNFFEGHLHYGLIALLCLLSGIGGALMLSFTLMYQKQAENIDILDKEIESYRKAKLDYERRSKILTAKLTN